MQYQGSELLKILKAISNEKRLKIIEMLMEGRQCNCEISEALGLPLNLVSHHMRLLEKIGLVNGEREKTDARWIYYSIISSRMEEIQKIIHDYFDIRHLNSRSPMCNRKKPSGL